MSFYGIQKTKEESCETKDEIKMLCGLSVRNGSEGAQNGHPQLRWMAGCASSRNYCQAALATAVIQQLGSRELNLMSSCGRLLKHGSSYGLTAAAFYCTSAGTLYLSASKTEKRWRPFPAWKHAAVQLKTNIKLFLTIR